jgi:hypothetical protein
MRVRSIHLQMRSAKDASSNCVNFSCAVAVGCDLSPSFLWDDSSLAYRSNRDVRSSSVQEKSTDVNRCEIEWQGYSLKGILFH